MRGPFPKRPGALLLAFGLTLLPGSGCTTAGSADNEARSGSEIAELKRRVIELQQQARMHQVEMARLRKKVAALEGRHPESVVETRSSAPTSSIRSSDPPSAASRTEAPLLEEIDIEPSPTVRASGPPSASEPEGGERGNQDPPSVTNPPVTPAAQELYDEGYTLYHRGRYLDAESTFQRFLQSHGGSDLADNAQYWIGEARYARGDLRGALSAFRETVEHYPEGNKVPDALVKAGQALEALSDTEGARETYQAVLRRFPDSPAAMVARDRLNQLP